MSQKPSIWKRLLKQIKSIFNLQKDLQYQKDFYTLQEEIVPNQAEISSLIRSKCWLAIQQTLKDRILSLHLELENHEINELGLKMIQAKINELRYVIELPVTMFGTYAKMNDEIAKTSTDLK